MGRFILGTKVTRLDAAAKVTGQTTYVADLAPPAMLHCKLLLSRYPHARIKRIDVSRAEAHCGVVAVATHKDVPDQLYGEMVKDQRLFAKDKVRCEGEVVAAVAAETLKAAEEAVNLIEVEYEELPPVLTAEEALAEVAPAIHENFQEYQAISPLASMFNQVKALGKKNVCWQTDINKGKVEEAFAQADKVIEETFTTSMVQAAPLEPRAFVAGADAGGKVTIWSTTQVPFCIRATTAEILNLPMAKIRVIAPPVGGAFGSKMQIGFEPHVAVLALKTSRPVKLVLTRSEDHITANPRHPAKIVVKSGVKKDGTILGRAITVILDTGYCSYRGPIASSVAARIGSGPYRIPNLSVSAVAVYTNKPSCSMVRAPAGPQVTFAIESHTDTLARALGMDPLEFRLKNALLEGDRGPTNEIMKAVSLTETLRIAAEKAGWPARPDPVGKADGPTPPSVQGEGRGLKRAVGLACGWWSTNIGRGSGATVQLNEDGTVCLLTGATEQGSGTVYGALAQIVAEELELPLERISIICADTDVTPWDFGAVASRTTFNAGHAVRAAAIEAKKKLFAMAAKQLEAREGDLELSQGKVYVKGTPEKGIPYTMLCAMAPFTQGPIVGCGSFNLAPPAFDHTAVQRSVSPSMMAPSFCTQMAEVEVNEETGEVRVIRMVVAQDVGFAINPLGIEGQIEGGVSQGIGFALTERVTFQDGKQLNPSYLDFKVPLAPDMPRVDMAIVEKGAEEGPYGAKGIGEAPIVPTAAAIANAIYNATGCRLYELPMTQERVLAALKGRKRAGSGKA